MSYATSRNPEGRPSEYGETKTRVNMSLTPTSVDGLDILARTFKLSRSEFIERIGRGLIAVSVTPQMLAPEASKEEDAVAV
ncbi:hypothetical protein IQ265_09285 [Nodosilinea sp. LEGE 06152]|uniref:hypothetical protein n=1 Tax=Nodosilinea sp. LEGE 06152 TaxID=2777966 RepID=UPI00187DE59B|nr:hypothetical protein [Nodosilinea sp. LEGE 06152]MBE9157016.1 hypothetical protein [Nodosilinea sp. LEGE 06152]